MYLEYWTREDKHGTNKFIKKQLQVMEDEIKSLSSQDNENNLIITTARRKRQYPHDIFNKHSSIAAEVYEKKQNNTSEVENNNQSDELLNYKTLMLKEKGSKQEENPLLWWKSNEKIFPILSALTSKFYLVHIYMNSFYFIERILSVPIVSIRAQRQFFANQSCFFRLMNMYKTKRLK